MDCKENSTAEVVSESKDAKITVKEEKGDNVEKEKKEDEETQPKKKEIHSIFGKVFKKPISLIT